MQPARAGLVPSPWKVPVRFMLKLVVTHYLKIFAVASFGFHHILFACFSAQCYSLRLLLLKRSLKDGSRSPSSCGFWSPWKHIPHSCSWWGSHTLLVFWSPLAPSSEQLASPSLHLLQTLMDICQALWLVLLQLLSLGVSTPLHPPMAGEGDTASILIRETYWHLQLPSFRCYRVRWPTNSKVSITACAEPAWFLWCFFSPWDRW